MLEHNKEIKTVLDLLDDVLADGDDAPLMDARRRLIKLSNTLAEEELSERHVQNVTEPKPSTKRWMSEQQPPSPDPIRSERTRQAMRTKFGGTIALDMHCPTCGALPDNPCITQRRSGNQPSGIKKKGHHNARLEVAKAARK